MFMCRLCDMNIAVEHKSPAIPSRFRDYMIDNASIPDITLALTLAELEAENMRYPENSEAYNEFMALFKKLSTLMLEHNTFFFHSAVVSLNDEGYIFTGKSGAGKSTHAMLWQDYLGAEIINIDKPLFRIIGDEIYAYGNPWAGTEDKHANKRVKIKAAAFIEQSTENSIAPISTAEVISQFFNQTVYMSEPRLNALLLDMMDKFLSAIPFYRLRSDISKSAAEMAYNTMKGEM